MYAFQMIYNMFTILLYRCHITNYIGVKTIYNPCSTQVFIQTYIHTYVLNLTEIYFNYRNIQNYLS